MRSYFLIASALISLLFSNCQSNVDLEIERAAILKLNDDHRKAHLTGDANLFVEQIADTITTIQDGQVYINSREATYQRFSSYFNTVKYASWDDTASPTIHISPDGRMATLIAQKEIQAGRVRNNPFKYDTSYWAWMASYIKQDQQWKLFAISSGKKQ
jgi:hypothetical protein